MKVRLHAWERVEPGESHNQGQPGEEDRGIHILEPLEVLWVDKFGDSAVVIKTRIKTRSLSQWRVGHEMNRRIKKKFDELDIEISFPHRSVYFGEASKPFRLEDRANREALKEVVRGVLAEAGPGREEAKRVVHMVQPLP